MARKSYTTSRDMISCYVCRIFQTRRNAITKLPRKVPVMTSDEEAEAFLAQDLSHLDYSQFRRGRLEFAPKDMSGSARRPSTQAAPTRAKAKVPDVRQSEKPGDLD